MTVKTVTGTQQISLEPGTQEGQEYRVKGKGIPVLKWKNKSKEANERGDLIIRVKILIPKASDLTKE